MEQRLKQSSNSLPSSSVKAGSIKNEAKVPTPQEILSVAQNAATIAQDALKRLDKQENIMLAVVVVLLVMVGAIIVDVLLFSMQMQATLIQSQIQSQSPTILFQNDSN